MQVLEMGSKTVGCLNGVGINSHIRHGVDGAGVSYRIATAETVGERV